MMSCSVFLWAWNLKWTCLQRQDCLLDERSRLPLAMPRRRNSPTEKFSNYQWNHQHEFKPITGHWKSINVFRLSDDRTIRCTGSNPYRNLVEITRTNMPPVTSFAWRSSVLSSGAWNCSSIGDFCSVKILRHRRGSNTRSSLYESDALPLGHCAMTRRQKP